MSSLYGSIGFASVAEISHRLRRGIVYGAGARWNMVDGNEAKVGRMGLLATVMATWLVGGCCQPGASESLAVTLRPQETSMWCWAASGQMVMEFQGTNVAQCTQANNRFGVTNCGCSQCSTAGSSCVTGGWPEFDKYGFTFQTTSDAPLAWATLRGEVSSAPSCGTRAFAFSWHWPGGGGHMMVVNGYSSSGGVNWVDVLDPWAPCTGDDTVMSYDFYNTAPGDHTHWNDYYQVIKGS
jgi:Papain-like cysteine protease AvrRpt2